MLKKSAWKNAWNRLKREKKSEIFIMTIYWMIIIKSVGQKGTPRKPFTVDYQCYPLAGLAVSFSQFHIVLSARWRSRFLFAVPYSVIRSLTLADPFRVQWSETILFSSIFENSVSRLRFTRRRECQSVALTDDQALLDLKPLFPFWFENSVVPGSSLAGWSVRRKASDRRLTVG